jgi:glycosyltransferase involved in cell wall biosynthesis
MRRIAIVEHVMSAGGVERVLRGLASAFLSLPEASDCDITFLLSRYNSAGDRCEWPDELTGPRLHVEWLGERFRLARALDALVAGRGILGLPRTQIVGSLAGRFARTWGPSFWRRAAGDRGALISQASARFDLMCFTYPGWTKVPGVAIPVVTTPQDFNYKHFYPPESRHYRMSESYTRAWLERSDRILLSSEAVRRELEQFWPEHASKAAVIRLGIAHDVARPDRAQLDETRRRLGLPDRFVLVAGWVVEHKNQLAVVEALRHLRAEGTNIPVAFTGPNTAHLRDARASGTAGSYVPRVREALAAAGMVHGRDFFALGYVSDADIQSLYRLATVLVVPSLYEGFGLPGLEAMLAGCPTLLSAIPPFEEQNRLLGGIVPMFDHKDPKTLAVQLRRLLERPAEAADVARIAQSRVAQAYDWKNTARGYLEEFAHVIDAGQPGSAPRRS